MYRLIIALSLLATVSQALPTNATVRMATESYVTNRVAIGVASAVAQAGTNTTAGLATKVSTNDATYLDTVSKAASALQAEADSLALGQLTTHTNRTDNPHVVTASQLGAVTTAMTNGWTVSQHMDWLLASQTNGWVVAPHEAWLLASATNGWTVSAHEAWLTSEADSIALGQLATHTNRTDNPHMVTASQLGALTAETDPSVDGKITSHNTNLTAHATLFGEKLDKTSTNGWTVSAHDAWLTAELDAVALGRLTTHTNRTDNPHLVTAAQVGALTALETTNAIAASMSGNLIVQLTTNKTTAYTFAPTNATYIGQCVDTALPAAGTVSVPIGTNGNYALAWGCTNSTFTSVEGTYVNGQLFCAENEAGDITAKVEIYRRDIVTDVMSEWGDGGATFTVPASATPQVVSYSVWVPSIDTNSFRVWARIKRVGGSATSARLLIVGSGSGTPTHFSMTVPATVPIASHNADATAHPFILSRLTPSVLTNQTWGALGTNATYRMSWDITNGTFKVEEILP
jgi:hypothetical protein